MSYTGNTDVSDVKVRFCPSPTGVPHVGLIRTALFNWAQARGHDGDFVFRIEDTDAARDSQESYDMLLDGLNWLGIDWDEGVEKGGPAAPYRQSERGDTYDEILVLLKNNGYIYPSYSTPDEVEQRHKDKGEDPKKGYDNFDRNLTLEQIEKFEKEGRTPVWRFKMPDDDIELNDLVRGDITFPANSIPDFAVTRANGAPLYTLVNPVDDALMGITQVLRGEDLLSSTPRQIALHRALVELGVEQNLPQFGHLPYVMGQGNKKLSKRDPESNLFLLRDRGFIREGLINYLALLGWSFDAKQDTFSPEEFIENFDINDVLGNPARFDIKKAEALNGTHIRQLDPADFEKRLVEYLQMRKVLPAELSEHQATIMTEAAPLVQARIALLEETIEMLEFFFIDDDQVEVADNARKAIPDNKDEVLDATINVLEKITEDQWDAENLQRFLKEELVDNKGFKPRDAFSPSRIALSGKRISPPLFESMVILGKSSTLARLERGREIF